MPISKKVFHEANRLNKLGLHLQAYKTIMAVGELDAFDDVESILLASSIAQNLGANEISTSYVFKAW